MSAPDDRPDCITASELERVYSCPGFPNLKRAVKPPRTEGGEDAQIGTRCHAGYAGEPVEYLNDDEEIGVARAVAMTNALAESLGFNLMPITERRLFAGSTFSGKPDRIYIDGCRAFIPDAKFGRIRVTDTASNKQMRGYVALVAYNWPELTEITVATIQPWVGGEPSVTVYGIAEIGEALAEVFGAIQRTTKPGAPRIPGEHCKYCPLAGVHCPESRESALSAPLSGAPAGITPDAIAATMTGPTLAHFLARIPQAEDVFESCRAEAKRRLAEDPNSVPGWGLKPGRVTETINDPEAVFARAEILGVTQKDFIGAVTVGKEKLKALVKKSTNLKGRELDVMIDSITLGATASKTSSPILSKS